MKSSSVFAPVLLPALFATSFAQEASSARQGTAVASSARSTATSSLDLEDERATCFKDCYRKYGALASCRYGASSFDACWCSDDDWTEREEDCVWEICGVDAYNDYANIRPRVCETVSIPSNRASNSGSPGTSTRSSIIVSATRPASKADQSTQTRSSEPTSASEVRQTTTAASSSQTQSAASTTRADTATSTTAGAAAGASQTPNGAARVAWSSSKAAGIALLFTYLYTLL